MKKKLTKILGIGLVLALLVSLLLMAAPVSAGGGNTARGAVKAELTELETESHVVGTVILNTTASGTLIVVIKIDDLPNLENYDVRVWVNHRTHMYQFVDVLNTDANGYGNAQLKINLPSSLIGTTIDVGVVFRENMPDQTWPCYSTNWPNHVTVPLK